MVVPARDSTVILFSVLIGVFLILGSCSCRTLKAAQTDVVRNTRYYDTLIVDRDNNKYPVKTLLDGKFWMTANLNTKIPNSFCYENLDSNCKEYGRLYTWESAKQGCALLGQGWRLPTAQEGKQLTSLYGQGNADSSATRKEAYKSLMNMDISGFNAVLGGGRNPDSSYARGNAHGFYWTSTENTNNTAWFFNFAKGSQAFYMQNEGEKVRAFSVRCVESK